MDQEGLLEGLHTTEHTNILERHLKNEPRFLFGGNSPKGCNIGFLLTSNDRSHQDRVKESNVVKCQNFQNLSGQSTGTCDSSNTNDLTSLKFLPVNVLLATELKEDGSKYKMNSNPRGLALIINNIDFDDPEEFPTRDGADNDEWRLKELWEKLHFRVEVFRNKSSWEILMAAKSFSERKELIECDCLIVTVMSHGEGGNHEDNSNVFGTDGIGIPIYDIIDHFNHESLKNKPKIFFFQACRGMVGGQDNLSSKRVCLNERKGYEGIPNEPGTRFENVVTSRRDMFIACPVAPGRPANRDPIVGSWFIQSIIEVFAAKACNTHLDELMKSVDLEIQNIYSMYYKTKNKCNMCSANVQATSIRQIGWDKNLYFNPGWARTRLTGEVYRIGSCDLDGFTKNEKDYPEQPSSAVTVRSFQTSSNKSDDKREREEDQGKCCRVS